MAELKAERAAIPALPANAPAARLAEYRATRDAELARIEPQLAAAETALAALPKVETPAPGIDPAAMIAIVILIEAIKVAALWAIGQGHAPAPVAPAQSANPARDLARKRWNRAA